MSEQQAVSLPATDVPVCGDWDVVVCGGGSAGIAAAIAASRSGARTLLIERLASLGGMATAAQVNAFMDTPGGPVYDELLARLLEMGGATPRPLVPGQRPPGRYHFDGEMMRVVAMSMLCEADVDLLLDTTAFAAWSDAGAVRGVLVANKAGQSLVRSGAVVDCTADADIAVSAGARYLMGDPEDGRWQHCNYKYRLANVDQHRYEQNRPDHQAMVELFGRAQREGLITAPQGAYDPPAELFPYDGDAQTLKLTYWEIDHVDATHPFQVSAILAQCQQAVLQIIRFCREHLPGYEKVSIASLPWALGVRETRRVVGLYRLTADDVLSARKFDDGIARACFYMDLHDSPPGTTYDIRSRPETKYANSPPVGDYYEIPYRCLVPEGVRGLLVAGRCISADRGPQGSVRVMPTCMYTGEAAGIAAALAVSSGLAPDEVDARLVRQRVLSDEADSRPGAERT